MIHLLDALASITWEVQAEITQIGFFSLRWYGLLFASAFLAGQAILLKIYRFEGKKQSDVELVTVYMIVATVVGARLGHCLFYDAGYYLANPIKILKIWEGGLASHGAAIGILTGLYLYTLKKPDQSYLWLLDRVVITIALAAFFIRTGNLMNSEIVGKPTDLPWGFIFVNNSAYESLPRHPAQLYEALSSLVLFFILYFGIYLKFKKNLPSGRVFGVFLIWIFGLRFFYEFLKENQVGFEENLPINMGQILSIPLVLAGIYILYNSFSRSEDQARVS